MGCEYYRELISLELDGELEDAGRAALSAHLNECEDCRRYAAALREIAGGIAEEAEVPAGFADSVMAKLPKKKTNVISFRRWGSIAAAAVLAIALGGTVFAPRGKEAAMAAPMAPAAGDAAPAEAQAERNDAVMFAAPRAEEAKMMEPAAAECAEAETTEEAAFDPVSEAALAYASEKLPGHWEILSAEDNTVTLRHEGGAELTLVVGENGEVSEK